MNVDAQDLLDNPDVPEDIKRVIRAEQARVKKVKQPRPVRFSIVGGTPPGKEVVPGRRTFHESGR